MIMFHNDHKWRKKHRKVFDKKVYFKIFMVENKSKN